MISFQNYNYWDLVFGRVVTFGHRTGVRHLEENHSSARRVI